MGPRERVVYRRVELACGERVLCEAENWYVPSRLTAEIREILANSDTPFGRAVTELNPVRETFAVEIFWRPRGRRRGSAAAKPTSPGGCFSIAPSSTGRDAPPFAEVNETYTNEILAFGPPEPSAHDKSIA